MLTTEVYCMAPFQVFDGKGRHGDALSLQLTQGVIQTPQILCMGQDHQIGVAAKFGCAVEHASLPPHQQGTDPVRCHRRKDFAYPARDQGTLQWRGNAPRARRWHASVPAASSDTTLPILLRRYPRVES